MAAINAAGYDDGVNLPDNSPVRKEVRDYLATKRLAVLPDLKLFYRHHMQKQASQDVSQYISWALAVSGAPDFAWKTRDVEVPPDALALTGFQTLMIDFYNQARLDELWAKVKPAYDRELLRYHEPLLNMTGTIESYLRISTAEFHARHFHAFVELLAAPELVQTRSYGDDLYVIISPAENLRLYDIRHSYLHFQIDPIMIENRAPLAQKRSLIDLAGTAPLEESYKTDFVLLANESLIKAVEARLDKDTGAIDRALHQGYILTPYFAQQLPVYEKQQLGMHAYAEDLINAIDLQAETARLSTVKFDSGQAQRVAKKVVVSGPELSPSAKTLEKAEDLYSSRNLEEAKVQFGKALEQKGEPSDHAQAWYGLARIAVLEKRVSLAVDAFQKTLESSPDDFTRAWSNVYLGRLAKLQKDFPLASKYFQDALAVSGATEQAKKAARDEIQDISKNQEKQTQ